MVSGETVVINGTGFCSVTELEPDLVLSVVSTAATVMVFGLGGNSGAANNPVEEIVPTIAFPPATPFTDQVSAGFEPSLVFVENCCVVAPGTDALAGETVKLKSVGPVGPAGEPPLPTTEAQPAANHAAENSRTSRWYRRTAVSPFTPSLKNPARQSSVGFLINCVAGWVLEEYELRGKYTTAPKARLRPTVRA